MEYDSKNAVRDFIKRTKSNLDLYLANKQINPDTHKYEVTQIINSFLGMIVLPKEKKIDIFKGINISSLEKKINLETKKDADTFFRHLRNSVSHGRFLEDMDIDKETKEIKQVTFKDAYPCCGSQNFEITLSIEDIKYLIDEIAKAAQY